jgi:hypothetical protein
MDSIAKCDESRVQPVQERGGSEALVIAGIARNRKSKTSLIILDPCRRRAKKTSRWFA